MEGVRLKIFNPKFVSARHPQTCQAQSPGNAGPQKPRRNGV